MNSSRGCGDDSATPAVAERPSAFSWLFPDLSLGVAVLTFFYCLFVYDGGRKLFRDSDSGWHIRTGEAILDGAGFPRADPYSFSRAGEPWYAWEWASDVSMALAQRGAGLSGVVLLFAAAIGAATWLWFRLHWAVGGNFLLACLLASPMLSTVNLHWLARPHVFGWLLAGGALLYLETSAARGRLLRHAPGIFLFSALWANLHASFFLAPGLALVYALAALARPLLWDLDRGTEMRRAKWFAGAAAVAALGTLANPYGWLLHRHVWAYLGNSELLQRVAEFQSFNFHSEGAFQILAGVATAVVGGVLAFGQKKLAHAALAALLAAVALRSARGLPVAALLLLPLANGAITQALRRGCDFRLALARRVSSFLAYSDRLRLIDARLRGWAIVPLALFVGFLWLRLPAVAARTGFPPDEFPVEAAAAVAQLPSQARLFAPDKYGGYLIYRFNGARKVFFDGRSDFYGSDFMKNYIEMVEVRPGWRQRFDAWGFTHALVPNHYSLGAALREAGWRPIHQDATATLLERK